MNYVIVCQVTGTVYVGKSNYPRRRFTVHMRKAQNLHLRRAIEKYGRDQFTFNIIEEHLAETLKLAEDRAYEAETFWIQLLRQLGADLYNENDGGYGGFNPSLEVRERIRLKKMGNPSLTGRTRSLEVRERIKQAKLGEKNAFFGRQHTEEAKRASRDAALRMWARKREERKQHA